MLHGFSEPSVNILLLQCFPPPFFHLLSEFTVVMKTALEQPAKNDLSTMFLDFLQVRGPNVHEVSVDAFDCALLPLQNAFDFQISPESLHRSHLRGKSTQLSRNLLKQEQANKGFGSCPSPQTQED